MNYTVSHDRAAWYPVPAAFPADEWADEAAWRDGLVAEFEEDAGVLDEDARAAVRELADDARAARDPEFDEVLLFCPRRLLVFGIVSILIADGVTVEELDDLVRDPGAELAPVVVPFATDALGEGIRAALVLPGEDDTPTGGFAYAFQTGSAAVIVRAAAPSLQEAELMLPFADELVRGIRLDAS